MEFKYQNDFIALIHKTVFDYGGAEHEVACNDQTYIKKLYR